MPIYVENQLRVLLSYVPNLIAAILVLIVGYIVARILSGAIRGLLRRTTLDNRLARALGGSGINAEDAIATGVFWLVMLFVLIGFFQALALSAVSEPLNALLAQVLAFIPRLLAAAVLLLLAWVVATVLKRLVTGVLEGIGIDRRLNSAVRDDQPTTRSRLASGDTATTAPA